MSPWNWRWSASPSFAPTDEIGDERLRRRAGLGLALKLVCEEVDEQLAKSARSVRFAQPPTHSCASCCSVSCSRSEVTSGFGLCTPDTPSCSAAKMTCSWKSGESSGFSLPLGRQAKTPLLKSRFWNQVCRRQRDRQRRSSLEDTSSAPVSVPFIAPAHHVACRAEVLETDEAIRVARVFGRIVPQARRRHHPSPRLLYADVGADLKPAIDALPSLASQAIWPTRFRQAR